MTAYPKTLQDRFANQLSQLFGRVQKLESRTASIDSGMPLAALPAVIDSGYTSGNPKAYINGSATLTGPYQYLASYTPLAGDPVLVLPLPTTAGLGTGQYVVLGRTQVGGWQSLGSPISGWSVGNRARYKMLASGLVLIEFVDIVVPASPPADGTVIWTAANGLPTVYQPAAITRCVLGHSSGAGTEQPMFEIETNGAIEVFGVGGSTITRLDGSCIISTL